MQKFLIKHASELIEEFVGGEGRRLKRAWIYFSVYFLLGGVHCTLYRDGIHESTVSLRVSENNLQISQT